MAKVWRPIPVAHPPAALRRPQRLSSKLINLLPTLIQVITGGNGGGQLASGSAFCGFSSGSLLAGNGLNSSSGALAGRGHGGSGSRCFGLYRG